MVIKMIDNWKEDDNERKREGKEQGEEREKKKSFLDSFLNRQEGYGSKNSLKRTEWQTSGWEIRGRGH